MKKVAGKNLGKSSSMEMMDGKTPEMDEHEVSEHLRNIIKAHEVMSDPEKMEKVHKLVGRHQKAITSLQDVEDYRQNKYGPKKMKG